MNIIKLFLFGWVISLHAAAASSDGIEIRLINGLDGTITIPAFGGLVLAPEEGQFVAFPPGTTELLFLYHNERNGDHEIQRKIEGIRLSSIFERCELRLEPDKDTGVTLTYNGLLLYEIKTRQRLARQETQPLLQVASADRVHRRKHCKQASLQQLKK